MSRIIRWICRPSPLTSLMTLGMLFIAVAVAHGAAQQYQYANACYDCHGTATTDPGNPPNDFRPLDTAFRNITTGSFKGNHRTHMAQTTNQNACEKCHAGSGSYTTGHMNERIDMSATINSSPGGATYSKGVFFNWTSNQAGMGTCANVNCHFQATTPVWGTANFTYTDNTTNDCDQCHGAPPSGGGSGTAGSHGRHDTYYNGAAQCKKCHADHVAEGNKFAHATSAANRNINVYIHDPADVAGGSYSGTGANFLPSQSGSQYFGNCTNLYCHSQGKSTTTFTGAGYAPYSTPVWGGAIPANCAGCHGGNVSAGNAISSNVHGKHINNAGKVGRNIGCRECHAATAANDSTIGSTANHVDKNINIKFDNSGINKDAYNPTYDGGGTTGATGATKAPGSGLGGAGCSNVYCHSDGHPVAGSRTYRTIKWNDPDIGCNGCHGTSNSGGYPDHGNAGAGNSGSNSHTAHAATPGYNFGCVRCHSGTTTDSVSVINGGAHLNGTGNVGGTDVKFDALNPSGGYAAGQSCTTTYCHSSGNGNPPKKVATWGDTMPADCTGCHGGNASAATYNIISSGRHPAHINNTGVLGSGNNFICAACHAKTVDNTDRTIIDKSRHVNNFKDYSGVKAGGSANYTAATGVCTSVYCHSSGQATPVFRNITGSKAWRALGSLGCNGCHGYGTTAQGAAFNSVAGEPNYTSGAAGSATANSHKKHVGDRGMTNSTGCADCHRLTVDTGVANRLKSYSSLHLNKAREVNFAVYAGYTGNYTVATKTCANTYCHSSGTPQWGGAALVCDQCHKASNQLPGAHKLHWEAAAVATSYTGTPGNTGDASSYQFECSSCHSTPAIHAKGPVSSIQAGQVYFGYSTTGRKGTYTAGGASAGTDGTLSYTAGGNCTTTYCHSNGTGGDGTNAVVWSTSANSATNVRCNSCHRYTAASGTAMSSGKHTRHVSTYPFGCEECHNVTSSTGTGITDKTKHINKVKDVSWGAINTGGTAYVDAATDCTNIYCHSSGTAANQPFPAPITAVTWGGGPALGCAGCHGGNNTASTKMNTNKHLAHINYTSNVGRFIGCAECHAATAGNDTTIGTIANHVNKKANIKFDNSVNRNSDAPTYDGYSTTGAKGYAKGAGTVVGNCNNVYCHSNGNINNATPTFKTIGWNDPAIGCDGCHGNGGKAHPVYASGAAGSATANSHVKHVEGSSLGCDYCHINTTTVSAIPPTGVKNGGTHLNRVENVDFKLNGGKTGSYDSTAKTCSTTYCHGTGPSVAWGGSTTCASCHDASSALALRHDRHYNSATVFWNMTGNNVHTGSAYVYGCKNCHPTNQHANGAATANRDANIATSGVSKITAYTENGATSTDAKGYRYTQSGTCTTICHSRDGAGAAAVTSVNWGSAVTGSCGICHNKRGDASPLWSAPHTTHMNNYSTNTNFTCNACHTGTAASNTALQATAAARIQHPDGVKNVQFNTGFVSPNSAATYPNFATGCSNTYCHSPGTSYTAPVHGAIQWSGSVTCSSCHTGGTASGPTYGNGSPKANSHNKHVAVFGYSCDKCHGTVVSSSGQIISRSLHVNQVYNVAQGGGVTFSIGIQGSPGAPTQCNSISCHGSNNATWGTTLNCQDCHNGSSDVDNFTLPFTTASPIAMIKTAEWALAGHGKASGTYTSGNPAANFAVETKECEFCHDPSVNHNAGTNVFRLKNYSTVAWGRNGPCMICHGAGSAGVTVGSTTKNGTKKVSSFHYGSHHGSSNNGGQFCWDCHDGHGDGNAYMVHDSVARASSRASSAPTNTIATTFTLSAPPVWDDYVKTPGNNGICQVCHTDGTLLHFRSDLYDANHNPGTRCTYCHSHSGTEQTLAFKPSGNCDLCHGYPPVRRNLSAGTVFRQNNYSGAKFEDYSGGGGAHSIEKHIPATARASEGWANCTVCHNRDEAGHTMQTPVKPSKITIDVKDNRKFDYLRQLGPERYTGTLTDKSGGDNTNATGSCSNTSCHFKPSKKWSNER